MTFALFTVPLCKAHGGEAAGILANIHRHHTFAAKKKNASFPSRCAWGSSKDAFHLNSISEYASFQCSCDRADTPVHTAAEHGCLGESTCGRGCGLTPLPGSVHRHVYPSDRHGWQSRTPGYPGGASLSLNKASNWQCPLTVKTRAFEQRVRTLENMHLPPRT